MLYLSPKQRHRKCAIYRGEGGAGDATADASNAAALADSFADAANASAGQASVSALAASNSAIDAATSATAAASSASAAATSATNAGTSATAAATSATNAANSATTAQTAQTAAELAETNAETAQAAAALSASAAASSQAAVDTSATNAANSATAAATSANNAANSATVASTNATNASTSATAAASSASAASTSASNASTSATNAAASATAASGSATTATTQAGIATTQATNASNSATASATSATNSSNSASAASTSASNAATSATNAGNSATAAATSESNAAASAAAAAASYDNFDDRYLGSKSAAPTLDNDGNALLIGALYYNNGTVTPADKGMYVYDGTQWIAASAASTAILTVYRYTATAGQTTFTGADDNAVTLTYTAGSAIITVNGAVMEVGTDVTATSGTSIVLAQAALVGDEVNIYAFATFNIANTYTQAESDARFFNVTGDSVSGNLTFTGTGNRITGDFSNATASNRVAFQSSTTNGNTVIDVIPNGTATTTSLILNTDSAITNGSFAQVLAAPTEISFRSGIRGTGTYLPMTFTTGGSERLRIDTSGNLLVGASAAPLAMGVSVQAINGGGIGQFSAGPGSASQTFSFGRDNVSTGNFVFAYAGSVISSISASTGVYTPLSDSRVKKNIEPLQYGLNEILKLKPVIYNMVAEKDSDKKHIGLIAQEVKAVMDEAVDDLKDKENQMYGLDKSGLVPVLIKAIQELKATVDEQAARIATLEGAV